MRDLHKKGVVDLFRRHLHHKLLNPSLLINVTRLTIFNQASHHPVDLLLFLIFFFDEGARSYDPFLFPLIVAEVNALFGTIAETLKGQFHCMV